MPGEVTFTSGNASALEFASGTGAAADRALCDAIPLRQSTRAEFSGAAVGSATMRMLAGAAVHPDVDVVLLTERRVMDRIRDLVLDGNTRQMADPAFIRELKTWLRFNPDAALSTGDGLFSATSGSPVLPDWLGPRLFDWAFTADAENETYARQMNTSSGLAIFIAKLSTHEGWVSVGRSCQRFALQATALGLKHSFVNQPVEVLSLRSALATEAGVPGRRPDLVMRFGYGPTLPYSARRALDAVMIV
jgi:Nitroreductase family